MTEFFSHAHQLNVELHLAKRHLNSPEKLHNLVALLVMLRAAGMHLAAVDKGACGKLAHHSGPDHKPGYCPEEVYEAGIPCDTTVDCSCFLFVGAHV